MPCWQQCSRACNEKIRESPHSHWSSRRLINLPHYCLNSIEEQVLLAEVLQCLRIGVYRLFGLKHSYAAVDLSRVGVPGG